MVKRNKEICNKYLQQDRCCCNCNLRYNIVEFKSDRVLGHVCMRLGKKSVVILEYAHGICDDHKINITSKREKKI